MPEDDRKIASDRKSWEERKLDPSLKRGPERKQKFVTSSGIDVKRAYDPEDLSALDFVDDLGFPGEYPFTRGVQPTMDRGRLWTMRQYAGFGSAEESNRRYRYLFEQGQTGLSVAFDLPTQMGRDSDHPLAQGEVGRVGVPICSLADMETLLAELPLDKISTSMTINATASILLALYLVAAERRGVTWDKVNGTIQNDVLKEYVARGTYIYPPRGSMRIITDIFSFASKEVPNWNTISISGYHIREPGSTALQAMAAVLGGAQSLHTNSKDEALALPTETSALLALRTQQVIAHESDVGDTVDPLGGSYYVERLTTELEQKAVEYISRIDDFGGAVAAIERGYMQREIQNAAFRSEEHTSELQSHLNLVCRLLLEKKKSNQQPISTLHLRPP